MKRTIVWCGVFVTSLMVCRCEQLQAGVTSEAVEQTAKFIMKNFGREVAEEGAEAFAKRLAMFGAQYGDEGLKAVQKAGPSAMKAATEAGEFAPEVLSLISKYGDEAFIAATDPQMLRLVRNLGDDAAEAAVRHGRVAVPICEEYGSAGAKALNQLSAQNGRRLGIMASDGTLKMIGKAEQVMGLLQRSGDKAAAFVWENKGSLAVATVALTFWATPDPFIAGTKKLIIDPMKNVASELEEEIKKELGPNTDWTTVIVVLSLLSALFAYPLFRPFIELSLMVADWIGSKRSQSRKRTR